MEKEHLKKTVLVAGAMIGGWSVVVGLLLTIVLFAGGTSTSSSPAAKKSDEKPKISVTAPKDTKDATK